MNTMINEVDSCTDTQFLKATMVRAVSDGQGPQNLEALADNLRKHLPFPNANSVALNRQAGVVVFALGTQQFVATPNLQVFELKRKDLFVTSTSILLQGILAKQEQNSRVTNTLIKSIEKAEGLLRAGRFDRAFALLESIRQTVKSHEGLPNPALS